MTKKILLLLATAALAGSAAAQGFGGGQGVMRTMSRGPMASAMLLNREDVQGELKLTEAQKGKLDALRAGTRDRFSSAFAEMRRGGGGGEEAQKAAMEKIQTLMEDLAKEALAVLDDAQKQRLKELAIQSAGNLAILGDEVGKAIGITAAQKVKIEELQRLMGEANQGNIERMQNGEIDRDELGELIQKNSKILDQSVLKVLTEAQRKKLAALGGAKFEFKDPKPGTPGAWGRPGGFRS